MNSRCAVGNMALDLKHDHGFALGARDMELFRTNPEHYLFVRGHQAKLSENRALGQTFHNMLLQDTCVKPDSVVDEWRLKRMLQSFNDNCAVQDLFCNTPVYKACGGIFIEDYTGCECFFGADFILPEKGLVVDVKTCVETSPKAIKAEIECFNYGWQAWWAKTGAASSFEATYDDFVFIFVGQNNPFDVVVYHANKAMLAKAQNEVLPVIEMYSEFFETGRFLSI